MEKEDFAKMLTEPRINKGVSARDIRLSIGQSAGYINNIENVVNLPSMIWKKVGACTPCFRKKSKNFLRKEKGLYPSVFIRWIQP